ncbi:MAG: DUF1292 domain-containing protein [Clostridia bacterium]|nr:DUF1292 domain-containing protein [Clostridia bacterium]
MAEEKKDLQAENEEEEMVDVWTLTDEDGNDVDFEVLDEVELDGSKYYAMVPSEESDEEVIEYVILKEVKDDSGDVALVSIDDDEDEFEKVASYFDNRFSEEIDYDEE